jgi:DNA-binding Lrp family transcriptional regulator|tara:strand:+ start:1384 stop:2715 length:1332 start_codon:yes stop_codon:yes gene_type:complete
MLEKLIGINAEILSANEKLVLLVFFANFEKRWTGAMTLASLAEQLGLRARLVASAVPLLLDAGFIKARTCYGSFGRPLREFAVNEVKLRALPEARKLRRESIISSGLFLQSPTIKASRLNWSHQLQSLDADEYSSESGEAGSSISPKVRRMIEGRKGYLDASDVLLLALLLAVSDQMGVVKGWSFRQIAAAIGVTQLAVKGRLKKLVRHRVLRRVIPGVAAPIFQRKLESVILLNTNHPLFSSTGRRVSAVINRLIGSEAEWGFVASLLIDSRSNNPLYYGREVMLLRTLPFHAFEQLEFMLLELASKGFECALAEGKIDRASLEVDAKADIARVMRGYDDGSLRSDLVSELIEGLAFLVYLLVQELDGRIRPLLAELGARDKVLMLPGNMAQGYEYIGVLVFPALEPRGFAVEGYGAWGGVVLNEQKISLTALEKAGLAAKV